MNRRQRASQSSSFRLVIAVLGFLCLSASKIGACPVDDTPPLDDAAHAAAAAAQVIGIGTGLGSESLLLMGQATSVWEPASASSQDKASESTAGIDRDILGGIEDGSPVRGADQNYYEARAYDYLLIHAHKTSAGALAQVVRKDLTFAHLFEQPEKYRGEVIHVEGRLRMLRKFSASRFAAKQGVPTIYEGWIFEDAYLGNPYCIIVSEVPASIPVGERIERRVAFDGYFFKRYRYKAQADTWRDAPLLIGHSLVDGPLLQRPAEASWLADSLLPAMFTVLGVTIALVTGLTWWYLRGDRQVRAQIDKTRKIVFMERDLSMESSREDDRA